MNHLERLTKFVIDRLLWVVLFSLLILPSGFVAVAQDSDTETELPELLTTELDRLSEDFPDILDIEWAEYSDLEVTMWLGDTYEQSLVEDMIDLAQQGIDVVAPELAPYVQLLANNPDLVRFVAFDLDTADTGFLTGLVVVREKVVFDLPILQVAEMGAQFLPDTITVIQEPMEYELEGYDEAASMIWSLDTFVAEIVTMVYMISDGDYIYSISFTSLPDTLDYNQALAELILKTMVINQTEEDA